MTKPLNFHAAEIAAYYRARVPGLKQTGEEWRGPCPVHQGDYDNLAVDPKTGLACCHSQCGRGWNILQLEQQLTGRSWKECRQAVNAIVGRPVSQSANLREVATYDYTDANGELQFQVVRFEPKTFRMRRRVVRADGASAGISWEYNVKGVRRVLYRLPKVLAAEQVVLAEGERDVESLEKLGFVASCNPGGACTHAGKWLKDYTDTLAGKCVVLLPDNDEPGMRHREIVTEALLPRVKELRVVTVPVGKDVSDWIAAGATRDAIEQAIREAPLVQDSENDAASPSRPALHSIQVNNRQPRDVIADAWAAIRAINDPAVPFLFQNGGVLVRITGEGTRLRIEPLGETVMYGILARSANWEKVTAEAVLAAPPSKDAARDMLKNPDLTLPPLESLLRTPTFGKDATLITAPGYHRADALWMWADASLDVWEVPLQPTPQQITSARTMLLDELLVDFPFVKDSDRAHAAAAILLPFMQRIIAGLAPIHLIEAPTPGSGKGLLANLISIVATGATCEGRTVPENEEEIRKMITAELLTGRPIILLDNLSEKRRLDSSALASVVTEPWWTDRLLGVTEMLSLRNHALWLMTGNNPKLSGEMSRRCIRLRIDPRIDMPWLRSGFKHPLIMEWSRENRSALVHAALTLIQAWIAAGKPLHARRLGSFEKWSEVMGGVLEVAGIPGFLGNLNELYQEADTDGQMWREFTSAWWEAFGEEPKTVGELNQFCEQRELLLSTRGDGSARSQQTRLGKALSAKRDRVFGGMRVVRVGNCHRTGTVYALAPADSGGQTAQAPGDPDLMDFSQEQL